MLVKSVYWNNTEVGKMSELKLNLFDNGMDFLNRGLHEYCLGATNSSMKYATLHIFQSIELILKEKLYRINPSLIYIGNSTRTIYLEEAVNRLSQNGVTIQQTDIVAIGALKSVRNQLTHFSVTYDKNDLSLIISNCIDFLHNFVRDQLNVEIRDIAEKEDWAKLLDKLQGVRDHYLQVALEKIEQIKKEDNACNSEVDTDCPRCVSKTMVISNREKEFPMWHGSCFVCELETVMTQCQFCSKPIVDYGGSDCCYRCGKDLMGVDVFEPNRDREDLAVIYDLIDKQVQWFKHSDHAI